MTDTTTRGPVAILPKQDSLVLRPLPDARAAAPRRPGLGWWIGIAIILTLCVVFQAKIGPAERFALHEGEPVPPTSFVHQQVLVGFTPLDIVVFGFAYLAALHRLRRGYTWFSRRVFYITLICTLAIVGGLASGIYHGTVAPFGDWRYIVTGAAFGFALWSTVMRWSRSAPSTAPGGSGSTWPAAASAPSSGGSRSATTPRSSSWWRRSRSRWR
jgi:hypothetical protein